MINRSTSLRRRGGFSLVEVVIALAVVTFALLPMAALLPVGETNYSDSSIRGRAVQVVGQIATCMQLATSTSSNGALQFNALAPFASSGANPTATTPIVWDSPSTTPATFGPYYFDGAGNLLANNSAGNARLIAVVAVAASATASGADPAASMNPMTATITVAWPATATYTWNGVVPQFTNIQGHEESAPVP